MVFRIRLNLLSDALDAILNFSATECVKGFETTPLGV